LKYYFHKTVSNDRFYDFFFVLEYVPTSLQKELKKCQLLQSPISAELIKKFSFQLLLGLEYLHSKGIVHRDIKPGNLLVNMEKQELKICDFGISKKINDQTIVSSYIGSRYYRAPELLLGSKKYSFAIDIWAAGCVIAEMLLGNVPLFQGNDNKDQLVEIIRLLGYPNEEDLNSFDWKIKPPRGIKRLSSLKQVLPHKIDSDLFQLLANIFVFNPQIRPTAKQCLQSNYFKDLNQNA
jgi:serine/threonine protein kinase